MDSVIFHITSQTVTLCSATGEYVTVPLEFTPIRRFLTQQTKRSLLATGFMWRLGREVATDPALINAALAEIRHRALQAHGGGDD